MLPIDLQKLVGQFIYQPDQPMIFNSGFFLFLFTGFLFTYYLLSDTTRPKLIFVILFSFYFYYKSSGIYFLVLASCTLMDFQLAKVIQDASRPSLKKFLLLVSLSVNLSLLAYFKYTNFLFDLFNGLAGGPDRSFDIFLPVGISFFTFQSLSYTLDVYRGNLKATDSILDYAFYLSFFPQLVAGPIVRAADFLPQIRKPVLVTDAMMGKGIFLIVTGLFKKAVISNYISLNFVDRVFDAPALYSGLENLVAVYGYALQIYCDFSGYSDMAIGIALLLGFHFNINFNSPYRSLNITEFWRRWHISLSSWLRDYLYISLGGNRKGKWRTYLNLMITMLLGGLWHGASLRFVLWGGLHGAALAVHKIYSDVKNKTVVEPGAIWKFSGWLFTFHFVCLCWIFFRANDSATAFQMIGQIFGSFSWSVLPEFIEGYRWVLLLMLFGYVLHFLPEPFERRAESLVISMPLAGKLVLMVAAIILVIQTKSAGIQPFIYFQF
ncbi:MAG: MBOAT family protein [Bacteroidetes bacterium]|nr:MBOAT family protein [Bacteroidota bacterium]